MLKCEPLSFLEIGSQWEGENHPKREAEGGLKKELKTSTRLLQSVLCEKKGVFVFVFCIIIERVFRGMILIPNS